MSKATEALKMIETAQELIRKAQLSIREFRQVWAEAVAEEAGFKVGTQMLWGIFGLTVEKVTCISLSGLPDRVSILLVFDNGNNMVVTPNVAMVVNGHLVFTGE